MENRRASFRKLAGIGTVGAAALGLLLAPVLAPVATAAPVSSVGPVTPRAQGVEQIAFFGSVEECRAKEAYYRDNLAIIVRTCGWAGQSMPVSQRWYFTYRLT